MYNPCMIEFEKNTNQPKPNRDEITRILDERARLDANNPQYGEQLGDLAERAAHQIEALINHHFADNPVYRFGELHRITEEWEIMNGNRSLDQKK